MMTIWQRKTPSFGFISTRFAGLDGVSLETQKWADVLAAKQCPVFYMAGELDTDPAVSHLVPLAHFQHQEIKEIQDFLFVRKQRTSDLSRRIQQIKEKLKAEIQQFHARFKFDILVVRNALAIPVNIPLGLAITEFIIETGMPTIAHHHDFYWERERFHSPVTADYLRAAFPPVHPNIQHVVINSLAGQSMGQFTGASWTLIPNVLDFKMLPSEIDDYNRHFKEDIGLDSETCVFLQPTRIVSRKGIETAAELVKRTGLRKASLVITHEAGDEGQEYLMRIEEFAKFIDIDLRLISDRIGLRRSIFSGLVLTIVNYALIPLYGQSLSLALVGIFLVFLTFEFMIVTSMSLCTEILPAHRATMMAAFFAAAGTGRVIGALIGGHIWLLGGIRLTGMVSAFITLLALFSLMFGLKGWRPVQTIPNIS